MSELTYTVASWFDRDDLVIEIEAGDEDVGLVTYDPTSNRAVIDLYPRGDNRDWHFDLEEVRAILESAHRRILEVAGPIMAAEPALPRRG